MLKQRFKESIPMTWQQDKEIMRKSPTCSLYNQTPLPAESNPKSIQRNEI